MKRVGSRQGLACAKFQKFTISPKWRELPTLNKFVGIPLEPARSYQYDIISPWVLTKVPVPGESFSGTWRSFTTRLARTRHRACSHDTKSLSLHSSTVRATTDYVHSYYCEHDRRHARGSGAAVHNNIMRRPCRSISRPYNRLALRLFMASQVQGHSANNPHRHPHLAIPKIAPWWAIRFSTAPSARLPKPRPGANDALSSSPGACSSALDGL